MTMKLEWDYHLKKLLFVLIKIIYDEIKKRNLQELEGWVQEKLTKSSDYLQTVNDYMLDYDEYKKK